MSYDYEGPTVRMIAQSVHTARFVHVCSACGGEIRAGDRYRRVTRLVDDEIMGASEHLDVPYCGDEP